MKAHKCKEIDYCICSISALEPDDNCPVHMGRPFPPKCIICGKFMKWNIETQNPIKK